MNSPLSSVSLCAPSILALILALWMGDDLRAEVTLEIPNELEHEWPGELVSFDLAPGQLPRGPLSVTVQGVRRPGQLEVIEEDGREIHRLWTYVTIRDRDAGGEKLDITSVPVQVSARESPPGIRLEHRNGEYRIDNGTYRFSLRDLPGKLDSPVPLQELPHWIAGMMSRGQERLDGQASFQGRALVTAAHTRLVRRGPVFLDFHVVVEFEQPADFEVKPVPALPLTSGKQSHLFEPGILPRETVPGRHYHYEALVRFVQDDPWIDVTERYHFPPANEDDPAGETSYTIRWGEAGMAVDTVTWVRWFEYDTFGGNVAQKYVPARPRPAQKGRPFALLRPRWNQGGGGAQDFFLTSGGAPPGQDPEAPAVGVVAAFASKWAGPGAQTLQAHARDGKRGFVRFPLANAPGTDLHHGQRAYGLCVGPRSRFRDLNGLVRRHVDWTLTAQIHPYILSWERDPSRAGPRLLMTAEEIERIRTDWKARREGPVIQLLRERWEAVSQLEARCREILEEFDAKIQPLREEREKLKSLGRRASPADRTRRQEVERELRDLERERKKSPELRALEKRLRGRDHDLLRLLTGQPVPRRSPPGSHLWRERRYQDDFLNPTSSPTRRITDFAEADLFAGGEPLGGASQAAMGYIATDLDAWPGWHSGWHPGNPNFHTDKYMAAIYVGGALRDHPHAERWLRFGRVNFLEDLGKVLIAPDGVGAECPGYSGYSLKLQLEIARILGNTGAGNLVAGNPLFLRSAHWHRKLITPFDRRLGRRHEAPLGDTHRWDSGLGPAGFARLARFYRDADPRAARELLATRDLLREERDPSLPPLTSGDLLDQVIERDLDLEPVPVESLDWSSQAFEGFGAILRSDFGTPAESFLTLKAGSARGHYHDDEQSFHFYSGSTPIALDYNCSYSPRGDHTALHNSVTFGRAKTLAHNRRDRPVPAQEFLPGVAHLTGFATSTVADLTISEISGDHLVLRPVDPDDGEFGRRYPRRSVSPIRHRRTLLFVKPPPAGSRGGAYLVVREEIDSGEPAQLNLHLLTREARVDGRHVRLRGQWDRDVVVYLARAESPEIEVRSWHYLEKSPKGPGPYALRAGESDEEWQERLEELRQESGSDTLPSPGGKPSGSSPAPRSWREQVEATAGRALIPPPGWSAPWLSGEYQQWLRIETEPGSSLVWVLVPFLRGEAPPRLQSLEDGVRVRRETHVDEIHFTEQGARIVRDGRATRLEAPSVPREPPLRRGL